jgi:anaerobic ribonucleoside-triphosphate reductase activating protein
VKVRIHAREPRSRANGPGTRFVIWMQGCTLGCAGCFNPGTHAAVGGEVIEVSALLAEIAGIRTFTGHLMVDGLTLSGGEPLQQAPAALELLLGARRLGLSTLVFSGYTIDEIRAQALGPAVLAHVDVLVDGRYVAGDRVGSGLRGSANQQIHVLGRRHTRAEVEATPTAEIRIARDGSVVLTGVEPLKRL